MKSMKLYLIATCSLSLLAASCYGPRAYTRGEYADPAEIQLLSDNFSENDLQLIARRMVESLQESAAFERIEGSPLIIVGEMENRTSEHIDMSSLADKVRVQLIRTDKFTFIDRDARQEIAEEYEYQQSGYVRPDQAAGPGEQHAADYLLTGRISSIVQEAGRDRMIYYKMTMQLTNLRTGVIEWADEKELRKKFRQRAVTW
ncbi:MAG: penicillin-binding protein activator LpoB [Myxococcota bacterium]